MKNRMGDQFPIQGCVQWIGVAPEKRSSIQSVEHVEVTEELGIIGDHHTGGPKRKRQVTLIQSEHVRVVAELLKQPTLNPELLRRNIVVEGINLLALRNRRFRVGSVLLQGTGYCHPCSRMEANLGPGGYNAMRGHGGITARVLSSGQIEVNAHVELVGDEPYAVEFEE